MPNADRLNGLFALGAAATPPPPLASPSPVRAIAATRLAARLAAAAVAARLGVGPG